MNRKDEDAEMEEEAKSSMVLETKVDIGSALGGLISKEKALPNVLHWLVNTYEMDPGFALPKREVYGDYLAFCQEFGLEATNAPAFGKILRMVFPDITSRRLGRRGQTSHHYNHFRRRIPGQSPVVQLHLSCNVLSALTSGLGWGTGPSSPGAGGRSAELAQPNGRQGPVALLPPPSSITTTTTSSSSSSAHADASLPPASSGSQAQLALPLPRPLGSSTLPFPFPTSAFDTHKTRAGENGEHSSFGSPSRLASWPPSSSSSSSSSDPSLVSSNAREGSPFDRVGVKHEVDTLLSLYRNHCQELCRAVNGQDVNFEAIQSTLRMLCSQIAQYQHLLSQPYVIDQAIENDLRFYDWAAKQLIPDLLSDVGEEALSRTLRLAESFPPWLRSATAGQQMAFFEFKARAALRFAVTLRSRVLANLLSTRLRTCRCWNRRKTGKSC